MAYMWILASCFVCRAPFQSNASSVPSHENNPICESCINRINALRRTNGLPEWPVPPDAYEPQEVP